MRTLVGAMMLALALHVAAPARGTAQQGQQPGAAAAAPPLPWAYPVNPPAAGGGGGGGGAAAPDEPRTLPGSERSFTMAQVRNAFDVADWRPDLHPAMPEVVSKGRAPELRACGFCHYPNGQGRPENSGLAGLPAAYIIQQMTDFRDDLRVSAEPRMGPPRAMIAVAKAAGDEEVRIAAEYFASLEFRPWIRVVETSTVPRTVIAGGMHVPAPEGGTEPIGRRIVEMPEEPGRTELRDPASGFVAYVPEGSLARGRELVTTGGGRTVACAVCHGADLRGLGPVPPLAGRSPSYTARQLYDLQSGVRRGTWSPLMREVVENLSVDDIVDIVAYTASLRP